MPSTDSEVLPNAKSSQSENGGNAAQEAETPVAAPAAQADSENGASVTTAQADSKEEANAAAIVEPVKEIISAASNIVAYIAEEFNLLKHYIGENYLEDRDGNIDKINQLIQEAEKVKENPPAEALAGFKPETTEDIVKCTPKTIGEESWERFDVDTSISDEDIEKLLLRASRNHYQAFVKEEADEIIYLRCASLFKRDYVCKVLSNDCGSLCWNYPSNIVIPTATKVHDPDSSNEDMFDDNSLVPEFVEQFDNYNKIAKSAAIARCRSRFPVPVILYKRKFICRSGTLAVRKGAAFEAMRKSSGTISPLRNYHYELIAYGLGKGMEFLTNFLEAMKIAVQGVEEMKDVDVSILKTLKIRYICDLMVENRKIHTGMSVSSSEKINMAKYGEFRCLRIPYPGCEFFRKYHEIRVKENFEELQKKELVYDWAAPEVDSSLGISEEEKLPFSELNWDNYKTWDLETLTKNYMRLLLHYLEEGDGGLLVHCISGWDRTPLFISMLRISLWADKLIHQELNVHQMAYLTLGYDWYLFGHDLPNRLRKNEEIMHFCFTFLPQIASAEYSLRKASEKDADVYFKNREQSIKSLSEKVLQAYKVSTLQDTVIPLHDPERVQPKPVDDPKPMEQEAKQKM